MRMSKAGSRITARRRGRAELSYPRGHAPALALQMRKCSTILALADVEHAVVAGIDADLHIVPELGSHGGRDSTRGRCGRCCRSRACASCQEGKRRDAHPLSHPLVSRNRTAAPLSRYAPRRTRTPSLLIRSQALYPVELWARVGGTRLELVASTMSTWRSNQLS